MEDKRGPSFVHLTGCLPWSCVSARCRLSSEINSCCVSSACYKDTHTHTHGHAHAEGHLNCVLFLFWSFLRRLGCGSSPPAFLVPARGRPPECRPITATRRSSRTFPANRSCRGRSRTCTTGSLDRHLAHAPGPSRHAMPVWPCPMTSGLQAEIWRFLG